MYKDFFNICLYANIFDYPLGKYSKPLCCVLTVTGYYIKKFMKYISTAEADLRMCWVSNDQKFHAKNEFGGL